METPSSQHLVFHIPDLTEWWVGKGEGQQVAGGSVLKEGDRWVMVVPWPCRLEIWRNVGPEALNVGAMAMEVDGYEGTRCRSGKGSWSDDFLGGGSGKRESAFEDSRERVGDILVFPFFILAKFCASRLKKFLKFERV